MDSGQKEPPKKAPQGLFSGAAGPPSRRSPAGGGPRAPAFGPRSREESSEDIPTREIPPPLDELEFVTKEAPDPAAGDEETVEDVALAEDEHQEELRPGSEFPPPLGRREGHDAWTLERMSRQSTVPPVRNEEVDRLRELSALRTVRPPSLPFGEGSALELVDRSKPSAQPDLLGEMEELYALDDLTGALRHAELILGHDPENEQAERCAYNCRDRLVGVYASKIGNLQGIPIPALRDAELRWLGLDHRSGFLLSRVDGMATVEEVLDMCGMPRLEALRTLVELLERGAIRIT